MLPNEIFKSDLIGIANKLSSKEVTSEMLANACLTRIKAYDNDLGSMLWWDEENVLKEAKESDERRKANKPLSPYDGIPIALKDMILSKGLPCTAASKILEGFYPPYEATVVKKLRDLGFLIIGKANQDEFAMGSSNETSAYKIAKNPWDFNRTPGGSSGGSAAALSAGMCFSSLGTDTGGSIRQPASLCGVVGVKPSYGRVSRFGIIAFASSLDQVGPFSRTVSDAAFMLSCIAGHDKKDSTSVSLPVPDYVKNLNSDVKGKKIGIPKEYFLKGLDPTVEKAVMSSLASLEERGAELVPITLPHTKYAVATYYIVAMAEASSNLSRYDGIRFGPRRALKPDLLSLYETTRGELFGTEVKRRIILGTYVLSAGYYDAYYLRAQKVRRLFSEDFHHAFKSVDFIVSPTAPSTAFKLGEKSEDPLAMYLNDIYTISANLAGICGISVPIAKDEQGLPIGLQIMAKAFDEQTMFNAAKAVEEIAQFDTFPKALFPGV